jgi:glutathione S-transferase
MALKLISFELCPFVQRACISLEERGVDYEITYIDLFDKPDWFLELSPTGKVPVLQVDDVVLFESQVIAEYLDETCPPSLHPADPLERARHRAWIEFSNVLGGPGWMIPASDDGDKAMAQASKVKEAFARFESEIVGPFFGGESFSLVDAAAAPLLQRLRWAQDIAPELALFDDAPKVIAWTDALLGRQSVKDSLLPNILEIFEAVLTTGPGGRGQTWLGGRLAEGRA